MMVCAWTSLTLDSLLLPFKDLFLSPWLVPFSTCLSRCPPLRCSPIRKLPLNHHDVVPGTPVRWDTRSEDSTMLSRLLFNPYSGSDADL